MYLTFIKSDFRQQLETELTRNIPAFWLNYVVGGENGGFHGALTNDLKILHEVPRASVLCSRILWTYSRAYFYLKYELYPQLPVKLLNIFTGYSGIMSTVAIIGEPIITGNRFAITNITLLRPLLFTV
jgi:hypothetical protein